MNVLKRNAIVAHSQKQMFELVNNMADYPRCLPWCSQSQIISQNDAETIASLDINWKGIHKSFTTKNILHPYESMEIILITGPFKHLEGKWHFVPLDEHACQVMLDLEFEFAGSFIDRLFQPVFQHIANTLVDAFVKRADEVYGQQR